MLKFPPLFFIILSLFFGASGAAYLRYGVYKRPEIGGHSFLICLYGILLIWTAVAIVRVAVG